MLKKYEIGSTEPIVPRSSAIVSFDQRYDKDSTIRSDGLSDFTVFDRAKHHRYMNLCIVTEKSFFGFRL